MNYGGENEENKICDCMDHGKTGKNGTIDISLSVSCGNGCRTGNHSTDHGDVCCNTNVCCYNAGNCNCNSGGVCKEVKHIFVDSEDEKRLLGGSVLRGRIPLRHFVYTNFQTAYQCVLTDIFVEKSLLQVWAFPVFMRHDFMNTFMIYLSYQCPLVKITVDDDFVITAVDAVEENEWKLTSTAITTLRGYIGFQLVLPRTSD